MNAIDRYFFSPLYFPRSAWNVIEWWESRRALYNVCVGAAGLLTLTTASLTLHLPPAVPHAGVPWAAVGVYALLANVCYSFGAPIDLFLRRFIGPHAEKSVPYWSASPALLADRPATLWPNSESWRLPAT